MAEQYVARDKRTGLKVAVTGEFPPHPDDRIRIARTTTLFTRLMSTILANASEGERREQFVAIETQLEMAEALIRGDFAEVQSLLRKTMERMGIAQEQLDELARRILEEFGDRPDIPPELRNLFGSPEASQSGAGPGPTPEPGPEPASAAEPGEDHADEPSPSGEEATDEGNGEDGDNEPPIILGPSST
ncbi:MAG: hypothetical protein Kow0010_11430 [Dehalococcoidia bacterium]